RQPRGGKVCLNPSPNARQRMGKVEQSMILGFIAHRSPARMIAILFASTVIQSRGLKVAMRDGADPDVGPGRGNGQRAGTSDVFLIANQPAVGIPIDEALAAALPMNAGAIVVDIPQTDTPGRCRRVHGA